MALVIANDDVPAGARLVGKGQHHGLFFFGVRRGAEYALFGRSGKPLIALSDPPRAWPKSGKNEAAAGTKAALNAL
jgi:hypothetical protein